MEAQNIFTVVILVQLFFSMAVTGMTYYMPSDSLTYITPYIDTADQTDFEEIRGQVEGNLEQQTNIPIVEIGALIFYSGNIFLDLILNFAFALPQMATLLIGAITSLINVPAQFAVLIKMFTGVTISVLYFISIIRFLLSVRSGRLT